MIASARRVVSDGACAMNNWHVQIVVEALHAGDGYRLCVEQRRAGRQRLPRNSAGLEANIDAPFGAVGERRQRRSAATAMITPSSSAYS